MAATSQVHELNVDDFQCFAEEEIGDLGGGLKSTVRLVKHKTLGKVAVKCFSVTTGPNGRKRLQEKVKKELESLQRLANDHVLRAYGWVKWHHSMGIVMPYMPAGNLRVLATNELVKLTPKLILRIAYEIASGLAHMHNLPTDERMIHGDLKPENVLLTNDLHCKVSDFGSAEVMAMTGSTTSTSEAMVSDSDMTVAYAAPEKLKNLSIEIKKEQDTYSFGMILYVLLARKTPYRDSSQESTFVDLIKSGERPDTSSIKKLRPKLSDRDEQIVTLLQALMEKCWQQDPKSRPSMIDVRKDLKKILIQQNNTEIQSDLGEILNELSTSDHPACGKKFVPLCFFSPETGRFSQGATRNTYNFPNVQQAAINCESARFEQPEKHVIKTEDQHVSIYKNEEKFTAEDLKKAFYAPDRSSFPDSMKEAADLLEQYTGCLRNKEIREAEAIIKELTSNIKSNFNTTGWEFRTIADKLRGAKRYLESIAMFVASASLFSMHDEEESLEGIGGCVYRLMLVCEELATDKISMKPVIKDHVIPHMHYMKDGMEKMTSVDEETKLEQVNWVRDHIESSEALLCELEIAKKAPEERPLRFEE